MKGPHLYGNDLVETYADDRVFLHSVTLSADMAMIASWQHHVQDAVQMPAVTSSMAKAAQAIIRPAAEHPESWSATKGPVMGNDALRYRAWTIALNCMQTWVNTF